MLLGVTHAGLVNKFSDGMARHGLKFVPAVVCVGPPRPRPNRHARRAVSRHVGMAQLFVGAWIDRVVGKWLIAVGYVGLSRRHRNRDCRPCLCKFVTGAILRSLRHGDGGSDAAAAVVRPWLTVRRWFGGCQGRRVGAAHRDGPECCTNFCIRYTRCRTHACNVTKKSQPMNQAPPIYLDYNATTPVLPEVVEAMLPFLREHFGNPSSGHSFGQRTRHAIAHARDQVANLLGCDADEIIFTSGGTEANNLAIRGITQACPQRRHIVTSAIEHPATARPCGWLEQHGYQVTRIGVDVDGVTQLASAAACVTDATALITVMHSNNETGVLQPIGGLATLARAHGALLHTDAAQSVGKVPVDVRRLDVDLLSIAGHKLYAPKGIGALYIKRGTVLAPFMLGAGHEQGMRPGTENVASIVGLGLACELLGHDLDATATKLKILRDALWQQLAAAVPGLALNGHQHQRLPNTLNVRFPNSSGNRILSLATEIAASTGSACHDGHDQASSVILAMGIAPVDALGSVRLTLGRTTTLADVTRASTALHRAYTSSTTAA